MFLVLQIPAFHVPGFTDSGFSCSWFYRFRLFMFLVLQIPAFHVPGFTDSGFSCSWFYRFRLFMFLVLQIPAFHVPGFTDSGFSCSWFSRSSFRSLFRSPIPRFLFYRLYSSNYIRLAGLPDTMATLINNHYFFRSGCLPLPQASPQKPFSASRIKINQSETDSILFCFLSMIW